MSPTSVTGAGTFGTFACRMRQRAASSLSSHSGLRMCVHFTSFTSTSWALAHISINCRPTVRCQMGQQGAQHSTARSVSSRGKPAQGASLCVAAAYRRSAHRMHSVVCCDRVTLVARTRANGAVRDLFFREWSTFLQLRNVCLHEELERLVHGQREKSETRMAGIAKLRPAPTSPEIRKSLHMVSHGDFLQQRGAHGRRQRQAQ